MELMKKIILLPLILFVIGTAIYLYFGFTDNAWIDNLPNMLIFTFIILLLVWARKKKFDLQQKRNNGDF